jgi:hypothetical protein
LDLVFGNNSDFNALFDTVCEDCPLFWGNAVTKKQQGSTNRRYDMEWQQKAGHTSNCISQNALLFWHTAKKDYYT